ncbi:MAG: hypothetical protein KKE76_12900 [Gammaproteobacteria bacterium]|nr:hypothetical protein [Gammaproteobacteria bacterium]
MLLDHLGITVASSESAGSSDTTLGDWYAKLMVVDRHKVVLWTNEQTLFSFIMLKVRAKKPEHFNLGFMHGLAMSLQLEGIPLSHVERILREYDTPMEYTSTRNKSVVASMNQVGKDFEHMVWYEHGFKYCNISELIHQLNNTPWKAIGYKFAADLVRERVISRCH